MNAQILTIPVALVLLVLSNGNASADIYASRSNNFKIIGALSSPGEQTSLDMPAAMGMDDGIPTLSNLSDWPDLKKPAAGYVKNVDATQKKISSYENFSVPPKPLAFLLYGLGGLPLAVHLARRRRKLTV